MLFGEVSGGGKSGSSFSSSKMCGASTDIVHE